MGSELSGSSKKEVGIFSRVIYDNSRDYAVSKYIMTVVEISLAYQLIDLAPMIMYCNFNFL